MLLIDNYAFINKIVSCKVTVLCVDQIISKSLIFEVNTLAYGSYYCITECLEVRQSDFYARLLAVSQSRSSPYGRPVRQNRGRRPNPIPNPISNPKSYPNADPNPIPNPKPNPKCYRNRVRSSPTVLPYKCRHSKQDMISAGLYLRSDFSGSHVNGGSWLQGKGQGNLNS